MEVEGYIGRGVGVSVLAGLATGVKTVVDVETMVGLTEFLGTFIGGPTLTCPSRIL